MQGLTIKSQFEKLCAAAEQERQRFARSSVRNWRIKTMQNLAAAIITTIAATMALSLSAAGNVTMKAPVVVLAVAALAGNAVLVIRRHGEKAVVHLQIAQRYAALAASCRASVSKYEERLIEDAGLQSLLEQHASDLELLKRDTVAA